MSIEIEAPDGTIVEFPDDTHPETIREVMAAQFGGGRPPRETVPGESIKGEFGSPFMLGREGEGTAKRLGAGAAYGAGLILTPDTEARVNMLKRFAPDAEVAQDEKGNPVVRLSADQPWQYINAPGLSGQDVTDFAGDVVKFLPAAKAATFGGGLASRAALGGAAAGYTQATGEGVAQIALGSETDPSLGRTAAAAAGGAAGEVAAPYIARGVDKLLRRKPDPTSALSKIAEGEGRRAAATIPGRAAKDVFIDPQSVPGGVVYHTTTRERAAQILRDGLSSQPAKRNFGATEPEYVFLADKKAAPFWRDRIATQSGDDVVTLEIPAEYLQRGKLVLDREGIPGSGLGHPDASPRTFQYAGDIPPEAIRVVSGEARAPGDFMPPNQKNWARAERKLDRAAERGGQVTRDGAAAIPRRQIDDAVNKGTRLNENEAAAMDALAREYGVRLSRGQATGDMGQLRFEQAARRGARGNVAEGIVRPLYGSQAGDVQQAIRGLSGDRVAQDIPEAGAMIQSRLRQEYANVDDAMRAAYGRVERSGARVGKGAVGELKASIDKALPKEFARPGVLSSPEVVADLYPNTSRIYSTLARKADEIAQAEDIRQINFADIVSLDRQITKAQQGAKGADRAGLSGLKEGLRNWMREAGAAAIESGDARVIDDYLEAVGGRAQLGTVFSKKDRSDIAGRVIDDLVNREIGGEEAINKLIGVTQAGGKAESLAAVRRIKQIVGDGAPEVQALRDAQVDKIIRKGFSPNGEINPSAIVKAFDEALDGRGREMMAELYTPEELVRMRNLRAVVSRLITPRDVYNPGSGDAILSAIWDFNSNTPGLNLLAGLNNALRATGAARGAVYRPDAIVPRSGIAAAAVERESAPPR